MHSKYKNGYAKQTKTMLYTTTYDAPPYADTLVGNTTRFDISTENAIIETAPNHHLSH